MSIRAQNMLLNFIMENRWRPLRHILLFLPIAVSLWPQFDVNFLEKAGVKNASQLYFSIQNLAIIIFCVSAFIIYFNLLVLVPKFLLKNKFQFYAFSCIAIAIIEYVIEFYATAHFSKGLEKYIPNQEFSLVGFISVTFIPLIFIGGTAGYKIFKKWIIDARHLSELKEAHAQEELKHLKSQINPHFLFNTLNNLHSLVYSNQDKASKVIHGLSDVLRYHLYETNQEKVLLKKDIDVLIQLLELEKIRRDEFKFTVAANSNINGLLIQPFVFINFVENAIKHSLDNLAASYIQLTFYIQDQQLIFTCKNSKPTINNIYKKGGIGLQNIQRRLLLMFGENYRLHIDDQETTYQIDLNLPI
jgi:two-component system, LytTR family, sensor kinase